MIKRIHHAQITIPSDQTEQARAFYTDLLGLEEIEKPDSLKFRGGFWLRIADQELHVSLEDGVDRNATKAHLAYVVNNLEAWREKFVKEGFEVLEGIPIPGYDRFETRDPFGNRLELIMLSKA
jgi:catechol 2,3-dioxygenase-like lactoylglutathione lyase family enzyme